MVVVLVVSKGEKMVVVMMMMREQREGKEQGLGVVLHQLKMLSKRSFHALFWSWRCMSFGG